MAKHRRNILSCGPENPDQINPMKQFSQIFFVFVPWYYFILIVLVGLLRGTATGVGLQIIDALLTLVALHIFIHIGYFIREAGRLLWAKIAGGVPHHIILGSGESLVELEIFRVKIALNSRLNIAVSLAFFENKSSLKLRFGTYLAGRLLTSGGFALALFLLIGFDIKSFLGHHGIALGSAFMMANFYHFVINLFPVKIQYQRTSFASDQVTLANLSETPAHALVTNLSDIYLMDIQDYLKRERYEEAYRLYKKVQSPQNQLLRINTALRLGVLLHQQTLFRESLIVYQSLKPIIQKPAYANLKDNWHLGRAWNLVALNKLDKAANQVSLMQTTGNDVSAIHLIEGIMLIRQGQIEEAIDQLKPWVNLDTDSSSSLMAAIFLCEGLYQHSPEMANDYLHYVHAHRKELSPIHKFFLKKVIQAKKNAALGS